MRNLKIEKLIEKYPFVEVFFEENNFDISCLLYTSDAADEL